MGLWPTPRRGHDKCAANRLARLSPTWLALIMLGAIGWSASAAAERPTAFSRTAAGQQNGWTAQVMPAMAPNPVADIGPVPRADEPGWRREQFQPLVSATGGVALSGSTISWAILIGLAGTTLLPLLAWLAVLAVRGRADRGILARFGLSQKAAADPLSATAGAAGTPGRVAISTDGDPESSAAVGRELADSNATDALAPFASLMASAVASVTEARGNLDRLPADMPLRQVLARELSLAGRTLDRLVTEVASGATGAGGGDDAVGGGAGTATGSNGRLHTIVNDLRRLADIAAGARTSLADYDRFGGGSAEPRTRSQAYRALGVNPDVDERIAKKLVDALRLSWHPDQARSEDDRRHREQRLKQINVAWDLIRGRRAET